MFKVKDVDRDGGTISLKCVMSVRWKEVKWLEDRQGEVIEICIDGRFGKEPKFWFGYPDKEESEIIDDEEVINYIIDKVAEWKKYQDYKIDNIINHKQKLRDWKINNLLDE